MELSLEDLKPFLPGLESVLDDDEVSELMVNGPGTVFVERAGRMSAMTVPELDEAAVLRAAVQIARPLGRDPHTEPMIDARLGDGSRVAICSPPAAPCAAITIRRFGGRSFTVAELVASGSVSPVVIEEARRVLQSDGNVLIAGGTGSGKTTLLNALTALLPAAGRVVSIEDTLELRLGRANCVRFEARGLTGAVTIRDLVRHALRHRPDHIVVGEVRGAEAADLLQALNTGHGGSLATVHANNATAALSRLASCAMQASDALPFSVVCRGVVDGIEAVIQQTRSPEGVRHVSQMVRVRDYDATENRWMVENVWPAAVKAGATRATKKMAKATTRRRRSGDVRADLGAGELGQQAEIDAPGRGALHEREGERMGWLATRKVETRGEHTGEEMARRLKAGVLPALDADSREAYAHAVSIALQTGQAITVPSAAALDAWAGPLDELPDDELVAEGDVDG